ncbi:MAG: hypothetical protein WD872_01325 [Pirellulaceae bacterium]
MRRTRQKRAWLLVSAGLIAGLAIGGALTAGTVIGMRSQAGDLAALDELRLRAVASHGGETFAIATGPIDEEVEGLYTLDYLTGDLQCFVINPRTKAVGGVFKTNITGQMGAEMGKKPNYLLVTGVVQYRGQAGQSRPAASVVYVADANTGVFAAYSFAWNSNLANKGAPQQGPMGLVGGGKARSIELRE